jgi:hypothetical protein
MRFSQLANRPKIADSNLRHDKTPSTVSADDGFFQIVDTDRPVRVPGCLSSPATQANSII